jgi:uncharacterized protein with ATP-grasp and redox domains
MMFDGAIDKVVSKLTSSGHIDPQAQSREEIENILVQLILGIPDNVAKRDDIVTLFSADYEPGTFMIGEIKDLPDFFPIGAKLGYDRWIRQEIRNDLQRIKIVLAQKTHPRLPLNETSLQYIEQEVIEILDHQLRDGSRLCDQIPLQEYTDVFRRIILLLLTGNPNVEINTYEKLDQIGRELALRILSEVRKYSLSDLLKISIASGLLGLNLKTYASATSKIYPRNIIPIQVDMSLDEQIDDIKRQLIEKATEKMAIDYWSKYEKEILNSQRKTTIAYFTDDYVETIFDLKFIETQLHRNKNLILYLIPRFMRYGNDASYTDVMRLLEEPTFEEARSFSQGGKLRVCEDGPRSGTVNGLSVSQQVANILKASDCVVVKGARSYEMLQGIRKVAYFGFAVCREISESVTGIDAEKGKLVFIRHAPGTRSFEGFRDRINHPYISDTGRKFYLSAVTAMDCSRRDQKIE